MRFRYIGLGLAVAGSLAALAALGSYQKETILRPLALEEGINAVEVPFRLLTDEDLRLQIKLAEEMLAEERENALHVTVPTEPDPSETAPSETIPPETVPPETAPPETIPPETAPPETIPPETVPPETAPPETVPPVTDPSGPPVTPGSAGVFEPGPMVDESWFDNALFIGDSRTDGLRLYSRLGTADYFCNTGLSVYSVLTKACSDKNFPAQTLEKLLGSRTYGKILIGLGINEAGSGLKSFLRAYEKLIDTVRQAQPDAVIIIQAIMTCSPKKERQNACFSPANLYERNEALRELAREKGVLYIDVNEVFADERGYLPEEFSGDGCHLYARYYPLWVKWIRSAVYALTQRVEPLPVDRTDGAAAFG